MGVPILLHNTCMGRLDAKGTPHVGSSVVVTYRIRSPANKGKKHVHSGVIVHQKQVPLSKFAGPLFCVVFPGERPVSFTWMHLTQESRVLLPSHRRDKRRTWELLDFSPVEPHTLSSLQTLVLVPAPGTTMPIS